MTAEVGTDVRQLAHYIGGAFVPPDNGEFIEDVGPATGQAIAQIPRGNTADVAAAVAAARDCFDTGGWKSSSVAERADLCEAVADVIEKRADELAELESSDTGKPLKLARDVDIPRAVLNFRFFAGAVRHDQTAFHAMPGAFNYTLRRPLGPVALVTPWNLPLYLLSWKTAPALAMGNTVVAKPSEMTPLTANALAEIFHELGAPPGVFNVIHGYGLEAGQGLVEHPDIRGVSFTGGTRTGAQVAATAAPQFKKLSLELGGKNPTVVFADCDFENTVEGVARASFLNQGQICLCGSRILVERPMIDHFTKALVEKADAMQVGDPSGPSTDLGALISKRHLEKVRGYLQLALEEGGTLLSGTEPVELSAPFDGGYFMRPTVISGLDMNCRTAQEEIFGPVVTVHPFDTDEEAIELANAVPYGLSASVWTSDLDRAHHVSQSIESGMVWVNTWLLRDLRVPFGGMKDSGVGREGGRYSLEFFSESRNVCIKMKDR